MTLHEQQALEAFLQSLARALSRGPSFDSDQLENEFSECLKEVLQTPPFDSLRAPKNEHAMDILRWIRYGFFSALGSSKKPARKGS